jgi:hypothetical protein
VSATTCRLRRNELWRKTLGRQRVIYRFGDIAFHCLTELRIYLIRDSHYPDEQHTEVVSESDILKMTINLAHPASTVCILLH